MAAICRGVLWTFFAPLGKKFFSVLLFDVGTRSLCESATYFPTVLVFIKRLCEFDFKKSCGRPSDIFENVRFIILGMSKYALGR